MHIRLRHHISNNVSLKGGPVVEKQGIYNQEKPIGNFR